MASRRPWPTRPSSSWARLTERERTVARLVAEGLTNRAVAARLIVSPHTVNAHVRHVFTKLGVNSRVALTRVVLTHDPPT
jgi:DNA-binding CsgD family transcriptional regulator